MLYRIQSSRSNVALNEMLIEALQRPALEEVLQLKRTFRYVKVTWSITYKTGNILHQYEQRKAFLHCQRQKTILWLLEVETKQRKVL